MILGSGILWMFLGKREKKKLFLGGFPNHSIESNTLEVLEGRTEVVSENSTASYIMCYIDTNGYRFKLRVIFTKLEDYSIEELNNTTTDFNSGNNDCLEYSVTTNTQGFDENGTFNFYRDGVSFNNASPIKKWACI